MSVLTRKVTMVLVAGAMAAGLFGAATAAASTHAADGAAATHVVAGPGAGGSLLWPTLRNHPA